MSLLRAALNVLNRASVFPPNPLEDGWWYRGSTAPEATSGVRVDEWTAMACIAVSACVRVIAETVSSLPLNVYSNVDGGKTLADEHPVHRLLHDAPNRDMTAMQLRETTMVHALLWSNAYTEIERNPDGGIVALWPQPPWRVKPMRGSDLMTYYEVRHEDGRDVTVLPADRMMHFRGLSLTGYLGVATMDLTRDAIGLAKAMEEFSGRFFSNGAHVGVIATHPNTLSDKAWERLQESLTKAASGLGKAHRLLLLEEGTAWTPVGVEPEKAQFIESRRFLVEEVCRYFRVPPHMVAELSRSTYCLPAGSQVFTGSGPRNVEDIRAGDMVWSRNGTGWELKPVEAAGCTGMAETVELEAGVRTFRATANHVLPVRRRAWRDPLPGTREKKRHAVYETLWIPAGEVAPGDQLLALDGLPDDGGTSCPTRGHCSEAFMEALGMLAGDGFVGRSRGRDTVFGISHPEQSDYLPNYIRAIESEFMAGDGPYAMRNGGRVPLRAKRRDKNTTIFHSTVACAELKELGVTGTARTKRVPAWIFGLAENLRLAFLRGYLDADGTVSKTGHIHYVSVNKGLIEDVRHLCMGAGIRVGRVGFSDISSSFSPGRHRLYRLVCARPEDNLRIGTHTPIYRERMEAVVARRRPRTCPVHACERRYRGGEPGISLERVRAVRRIGILQPVYNLSVADNHNFIAEGISCRNSNIEHQAIDFVVHCIRPWLVRLEQEYNRSLFRVPSGTGRRPKRFFAEHVVDGLLRGDTASRYDAYIKAIKHGVMCPDEARALENWNPRPDGRGKVYYYASDTVPDDGKERAKPAEPAKPEPDQKPVDQKPDGGDGAEATPAKDKANGEGDVPKG
jgi:HK97 family phage portal protein